MVESMELGVADEVTEEDPSERSAMPERAITPSESCQQPQILTVSGLPPNNVLVAASHELFGDGDLKAARIIIHDPTLEVLKRTATAEFAPLNRSLSVPERNYNWDPSVYDPVLPIRCRNVRGELHKNRFGSGSRGRSILSEEVWYTPSEFEALCGRANSKDWKRSIRYAGRTLQCLIEEGILRPHATSCTCSACCENSIVVGEGLVDATSGPVRLFTPYKRRKRHLKQRPGLKVSTNVQLNSSGGLIISSAPITMKPVAIDNQIDQNAKNLEEAIPVSTVHREIVNTVCPESVIVTPVATPQTPRSAPTALDFNEQRQWWQLEELVKNAVRQMLDLQKQVENVKNQCAETRDAALQQLRIQMENEKKEALNNSRIEAQMTLSRAVLEAKAKKELAVEQALQQARLEMQEKLQAMGSDKGDAVKRCANCDREAFSECTGCHRVSYCSTFCQRKDWQNHREDCGDSVLSSEECSELMEDCETITS